MFSASNLLGCSLAVLLAVGSALGAPVNVGDTVSAAISALNPLAHAHDQYNPVQNHDVLVHPSVKTDIANVASKLHLINPAPNALTTAAAAEDAAAPAHADTPSAAERFLDAGQKLLTPHAHAPARGSQTRAIRAKAADVWKKNTEWTEYIVDMKKVLREEFPEYVKKRFPAGVISDSALAALIEK